MWMTSQNLTADVQKAKHGINHGTRFLEGDEYRNPIILISG